jgi:hypothetical protein
MHPHIKTGLTAVVSATLTLSQCHMPVAQAAIIPDPVPVPEIPPNGIELARWRSSITHWIK